MLQISHNIQKQSFTDTNYVNLLDCKYCKRIFPYNAIAFSTQIMPLSFRKNADTHEKFPRDSSGSNHRRIGIFHIWKYWEIDMEAIALKRLKISFRSSSYAKYGRDSRQEKNVAFCFTNFLYHNFFCDAHKEKSYCGCREFCIFHLYLIKFHIIISNQFFFHSSLFSWVSICSLHIKNSFENPSATLFKFWSSPK